MLSLLERCHDESPPGARSHCAATAAPAPWRVPPSARGLLRACAYSAALGLVFEAAAWSAGSVGLVGALSGAIQRWGRQSPPSRADMWNIDPPLDACKDMFHTLRDVMGGDIKLESVDYETGEAVALSWRNISEAAELVANSTLTSRASFGRCTPDASTVVWFYPDWSGDNSATFPDVTQFQDAVCNRMSFFVDSYIGVECIAFYRVPTVKAMGLLLRKYHAPGSVLHAVVCGHGDNRHDDQGRLALSAYVNDDGSLYENAIHANGSRVNSTTSSMLAALGERLTATGTVTLQSCHGGTNGVAKMFSEGVGDHWVFGGVVSLNRAGLVMLDTEFSGGADGPVRVGTDTYSASLYLAMAKQEGQAAFYATKESILAWYKGQNMGLVTQWKYPSRNGKVVRRGCNVEAAKWLVAKKEADAALLELPVPIPPKASGVVRETLSAGVADDPKSGDAVVEWLPGGRRSVVAAKDFDGLVVTSCGD
uniref:Uncharacterized protein n=1 Tax=Zooxanthella nutricula TaxID=1333877 RepID=A0A7S2MZP2_9DINO